MADEAVRIGGPPTGRQVDLNVSPLSILLLIYLCLSIILVAVGISQNRSYLTTITKVPLDVSLSFGCIGLISSLAAVVCLILLFVNRFGRRDILQALFLGLTLFGLICFAIATGVSYKDHVVFYGAWFLSATWMSVAACVIAVLYFISERQHV